MSGFIRQSMIVRDCIPCLQIDGLFKRHVDIADLHDIFFNQLITQRPIDHRCYSKRIIGRA